MYRFCIICWFILLSTGIYLVQRNPEFMRHEIDRNLREKLDRINESMGSEIDSFTVAKQNTVSVQEGVTSPKFWHMGLMMFNGIFFGAYIASVYKSIDLDKLSDSTLTTAGAIGSICNGGSRVFWATI